MRVVAGLGLVAYPGQGACKSLYASWHASTRKLIIEKRIDEGRYMMQDATEGRYDAAMIIRRFDNLKAGIDEDYQ